MDLDLEVVPLHDFQDLGRIEAGDIRAAAVTQAVVDDAVASGGALVASHLPILLDESRGEKGTLCGHMARANPQWRDFAALAEAGREVMVVFQGPHAYVSPRWYGPSGGPGGKAVPTWNYMAVHAYGLPRLVEQGPHTRGHLGQLVATQEAGRPEPWSLDSQGDDYVGSMMRGIVAFEIPIARLDAKAKLSQNKTPGERVGVIAALAESEDSLARAVAEEMRARGL